MKRRVFIVHGWGGSPDEPLLKWLAGKLSNKGFEVHPLKMPFPDSPRINLWVNFIAKEVGKLDESTFFVGHSIGCQAIIRYLETQKNVKAGGVVFVAGWFSLNNLKEDEIEIARPWVEDEVNLDNVREKAVEFVAIFSDNDPHVPLSDKDLFENLLGAKIIVKHEKGHFTEEDGVLASETLLREVVNLAKRK